VRSLSVKDMRIVPIGDTDLDRKLSLF
jgi:hypothetical protein